VGQEPVVGRREGVMLVAALLFSVLRKWVARQVRWDLLSQVVDGQVSVLAPESGSGEEQSMQFSGEARRAFDFSM
jgi:hypothetical protein